MDYSILSGSPLFFGISAREIESALSSMPYRLRKFRDGSLIAQSGDTVSNLLIVISGKVKGEMIDFAGKVIKIEDIPAPMAIAPAFIFGNRNRFPVNVITVGDTMILELEKKFFLVLLKSDERILVNFMNMISNRSQFLTEKIKFLNFKTIRGKLAQYILEKTGKEGKERTSLVLDMTQNEIADFFGVARPSVARALGEMEDEGLISARGKNIRITDIKGLSALTSE